MPLLYKVTMTQSGKNAASETASYISQAINELEAAKAALQKLKGMGVELYVHRIDEAIEKYENARKKISQI